MFEGSFVMGVCSMRNAVAQASSRMLNVGEPKDIREDIAGPVAQPCQLRRVSLFTLQVV